MILYHNCAVVKIHCHWPKARIPLAQYAWCGNACRIHDLIYTVGMRIFSLSAANLQRVNMAPCHSVLQRLHSEMEQEDLLVINWYARKKFRENTAGGFTTFTRREESRERIKILLASYREMEKDSSNTFDSPESSLPRCCSLWSRI